MQGHGGSRRARIQTHRYSDITHIQAQVTDRPAGSTLTRASGRLWAVPVCVESRQRTYEAGSEHKLGLNACTLNMVM